MLRPASGNRRTVALRLDHPLAHNAITDGVRPSAIETIIERAIRADIEWSLVVEPSVTALVLGASPVPKIAGSARVRAPCLAANIEHSTWADTWGLGLFALSAPGRRVES